MSRALTGKLQLSRTKDDFILKEVAFYLGLMCRAFRSSEAHEDNVENADKTYFVLNMGSCRTFGFKGEEQVNRVDVVSGGKGMTMVAHLSGGRDSRIENAFMVVKNQGRHYTIRDVPDAIEGVFYRTGQKE